MLMGWAPSINRRPTRFSSTCAQRKWLTKFEFTQFASIVQNYRLHTSHINSSRYMQITIAEENADETLGAFYSMVDPDGSGTC